MNEATIGIIAALVSGATLIISKLIERAYGTSEKRIDDATSIRQELRDEVRQLRDELRLQRKDVEESSRKIYELTLENIRLTENYNNLLHEYKSLEAKYQEVLKDFVS